MVSHHDEIFLLIPRSLLRGGFIPHAVLIRYPGMTATVAEAKDAINAVRRLRTVVRRKLRL